MTSQIDRLKTALADRYAIEREIGSGGMATVYLAEDQRHHRKVAVKVLREDLAQALGAERFLREIEIAAQLQHPHILPLHDSGSDDGILWYVMPYVEGESLRERLDREGELPVQSATRILREVTDALAKAHRQGVVHRDIKPDNVMLSDGHAVVTDFGIAKAVSEATGAQNITTVGVALGTPTYMAPEQAVADPNVDHRADIYAVGVLAYEMLAGRPPFQGPNPQSVLSQHVTEAAEPVTKHRRAVPPRLEAAIMRCLEKKAADRWQTADELLAELDALATPSGGTTPMPAAPVARPASNGKRVGIAAVTVMAALAAVFFVVDPFGGEEPAVLDPEVVVVLPFAVTGPPDLQWIGEGIVNLFESNLARSEGLHAAASQASISAWKRAGGFDAGPEGARSTAIGLGAGLLLQGNMVGSNDRITVNATLTSLIDETEERATESGSVDSLATIAQRLLGQLVALQAGADAEVAAVLGDVPPAALRAYLVGEISYRAGAFDSAWAQFGRAIAIDSTFALAALGHARTSGWMLSQPASPGIRLAWANVDKLPERDRLFLGAIRPNYPNPISYVDRFEAMDRATLVIGDRAELWYYLGDRAFHYGQLVGLTLQQAEQQAWAAFERGLAIDPAFGGINTHKFDRALMHEDFVLYDAVADSFPDIAATHYLRLAAAVAKDDSAAVAKWFAEVPTMSFNDIWGSTGTVSFFARDPTMGTRVAELALTRATTEQERTAVFDAMRAAYWSGGRPGDAARVTDRMYSELRNARRDDPRLIQAALFLDGDREQAEAVATDIERSSYFTGDLSGASASEITRVCFSAHWRLALGDSSAARRVAQRLATVSTERGSSGAAVRAYVCALELEALMSAPNARADLVARLDSIGATGPAISSAGRNRLGAVLAQLYGLAGQPERAMRAAMRFDGFDFWGWSASVREATRYAIAVGDTVNAATMLDYYLRSRGNAEPGLKAEDDALREAFARLVGEGR